MRNRIEILRELVLLNGDITILEKELSEYPWDIEKPLFRINNEDFINILKKRINNEIDFETLTRWANAIECREDIDFSNEMMKKIIFELANPEINGIITKERLKEIILEME